jgi:hypothetical protein
MSTSPLTFNLASRPNEVNELLVIAVDKLIEESSLSNKDIPFTIKVSAAKLPTTVISPDTDKFPVGDTRNPGLENPYEARSGEKFTVMFRSLVR